MDKTLSVINVSCPSFLYPSWYREVLECQVISFYRGIVLIPTCILVLMQGILFMVVLNSSYNVPMYPCCLLQNVTASRVPLPCPIQTVGSIHRDRMNPVRDTLRHGSTPDYRLSSVDRRLGPSVPVLRERLVCEPQLRRSRFSSISSFLRELCSSFPVYSFLFSLINK